MYSQNRGRVGEYFKISFHFIELQHIPQRSSILNVVLNLLDVKFLA